MQLIPDDPIVDSLLRTGYPPWFKDDWDDDEEHEFDEDDEEYQEPLNPKRSKYWFSF